MNSAMAAASDFFAISIILSSFWNGFVAQEVQKNLSNIGNHIAWDNYQKVYNKSRNRLLLNLVF